MEKGTSRSIGFLLLLCAAGSASAQMARLTLTNTPSGMGTQPLTVLYTPQNTNEFMAVNVASNDEGPTYVSFDFNLDPMTHKETNQLSLQFSTVQLGTWLARGNYMNAQRAAFAEPGHPGIDVIFQHQIDDKISGQFFIEDAQYVQMRGGPGSYKISHFLVDFSQFSYGQRPPMTGTFEYWASTPTKSIGPSPGVVPEPSSMMGLSLLGLGLIRRKR